MAVCSVSDWGFSDMVVTNDYDSLKDAMVSNAEVSEQRQNHCFTDFMTDGKGI